jgi:hypothetical protein
MNAFNIYEAYAAVYDEDLREDILTVEEDFSFIDDLSDNELDQVMEEILSEGVELSECFEVFEELIVEMNPYAPAGSKEAKAYAKSTTKSKRSAEASERRAARVERIKGAAKRAGEAVKSSASEVKGGVVSGAKSAIGGAKAAKAKVSGKLASAKEKIKGFLGKVGRAAKAGASAAKKEFSGEAGREASARTTGRQMRRAARQQASSERGKDTSAFEKPKAKVGTPENPRIGQPAPERKALAPAKDAPESGRRIKAAAKAAIAAKGSTSKGVRVAGAGGVSPLATTKKSAATYSKAASGVKRPARKTSVSENYEIIADIIAEDLMNNGYASDLIEAYEIIIEMDDCEVGNIAENYLVEEVETVDLYDVVLEHLLDEGFADTEEAATVIMANMSEEWREEILDEAGRMHNSSAQQAGFADIKATESGGRGKKSISDKKIAAQPAGQAFLDRIKKTKSDSRYKD